MDLLGKIGETLVASTASLPAPFSSAKADSSSSDNNGCQWSCWECALPHPGLMHKLHMGHLPPSCEVRVKKAVAIGTRHVHGTKFGRKLDKTVLPDGIVALAAALVLLLLVAVAETAFQCSNLAP